MVIVFFIKIETLVKNCLKRNSLARMLIKFPGVSFLFKMTIGGENKLFVC